MKLTELKSGVVAHFAAPTNQDEESYRRLRTFIVILGIALPWAVWLVAHYCYHEEPQPSISAFYYTGSRDLFVGMLCAIGVFLLFYQGPQRIDAWVSSVAGAGALGVAVFPAPPAGGAAQPPGANGGGDIPLARGGFILITLPALVP